MGSFRRLLACAGVIALAACTPEPSSPPVQLSKVTPASLLSFDTGVARTTFRALVSTRPDIDGIAYLNAAGEGFIFYNDVAQSTDVLSFGEAGSGRIKTNVISFSDSGVCLDQARGYPGGCVDFTVTPQGRARVDVALNDGSTVSELTDVYFVEF